MICFIILQEYFENTIRKVRKDLRVILKIFRRSHRSCSMKIKVFLEISQISQENTCATVSFLIKPQACNFIK